MSRQDKGGAGMILNRGPPSGFETSNKISNSGGTIMEAVMWTATESSRM